MTANFGTLFDQLDEADKMVIMTGVVGSAGPDGMEEQEVVRQVGIVTDWVIKTEIQSSLLGMMRDGSVRAFVNEAGEIQYQRVR